MDQHILQKRNNFMPPLNQIIEETKSQISQPSVLRNASSKSIPETKSASKSQNKNDKNLDDILAQNDEQMDKSHKSTKSGNLDISGPRENDVSGLRMNTSLDKS